MPENWSTTHQLARGLFLALAFFLLQAVACPEIDYGSGLKRKKVDAFATYEEVWCEKVKEEPALKGKKVKFTSLYRPPEEQEASCLGICGKKCCPGKCACPGKSNHQHHATADVGGLPGDMQAGCRKLLEICNEIKACGQNIGCEIGGYSAGTHHLAADEGVKSTAYNGCAFLKSEVQQKSTKTCKEDKKKKDPPPNQEHKPPPPPPPSMAQQAQQLGDLMNKVMNPEKPGSAEYPKALPKSGAPFEGASTGSNPASTYGKEPVTKIGRPQTNPTSEITQGTPGGLESGGPAFENESSSDVTAAALVPGKSGSTTGGLGGSSGPGSSGSSSSSGASTAGPSASQKDTNELTASFGGGGSLHGGKSGGGVAMSGSETDAAVKSTIDEFSKMMEREPASTAEANDVGSADGESLFARCHAAHERSVQGGRVSVR